MNLQREILKLLKSGRMRVADIQDYMMVSRQQVRHAMSVLQHDGKVEWQRSYLGGKTGGSLATWGLVEAKPFPNALQLLMGYTNIIPVGGEPQKEKHSYAEPAPVRYEVSGNWLA